MSQSGNQDRSVDLSSTGWWREYNRERTEATTHRVTAFVRSFAPAPGQHNNRARVLSELNSAVEAGPLDDCRSTVLGDQICRCQDCQQAPEAMGLLEITETLATWGGGGLNATGFDERVVRSAITGEEYRVIVPPELSVGIYADDSLVGVFPSVTETGLFRPVDYVSTLVENSPDQQSGPVQELS
jgi:hypothetical protein